MHKKKLRDNKGVTIVLALAVFLVLTVFSSVMLTGAFTAWRNAARQRTEEQLYLSAASAAALLQKRICGDGEHVPYVEKVEISDDGGNAAKLDAIADETQRQNVADSFNADKASQNLQTGVIKYRLYSDSVSPSPELYVSPPNNPQDVVTYALCKMLDELSTWSSSDCTITISVPTVSGDSMSQLQPTSASLSMTKEGAGYLLTATLTTIKPSTPSSGGATYVSKWTFSCTPSTTNESKAFQYQWTNGDGYPETVWLYANIEKTVYKWKFETAERGTVTSGG